MENLLSQFKTSDLEIKLTNEKLFINTVSSNETFALRSVNGIGVVDLVDDYNKALTLWKSKREKEIAIYVTGGIFVLVGLFSLSLFIEFAILLFISGALLFLLGSVQKNIKPTLMSAVRIMMSGGNRDFQFDKTSVSSDKIAEFVAEVESTLTSYHKNN
jgi:hypothetical protein